jgi:endonuclease G
MRGVVWPGAHGLKSVGLIADQRNLLNLKRRGNAAPQDLPGIDVQQFRVAITEIQERTGLRFPSEVRDGDTIDQSNQPQVGEEARRGIRTWAAFDDLKSDDKAAPAKAPRSPAKKN